MSIFTVLHFSLMSVAGALFVTAIMKVRAKKGADWLMFHRKLALAGVTAAFAALGSMAYLKFSMNYPHFKSPHALGGLVSMFAVLVTPIFGSLVAAGKRRLRNTHRYMGRVTFVLFVVTAVFGVLMILKIMKVI